MRLMALDVGDRRIGVALSDPLSIFAQPHSVVTRDGSEIDKIIEIISEFKVERLIFGLPYVENTKIGPQAEKVLLFKKQLESKIVEAGINLETDTFDESMTTSEAHERLKEIGVKHAKRKKVIDKIAAVVILESYMSAKKL